jgi:hypothetical protein
MGAMIAKTFRTGPGQAALFIAKNLNFFPPDGNGSCHHALARGKAEVLNTVAGPLAALVAGIVSFGFHAVPDFAKLAISV